MQTLIEACTNQLISKDYQEIQALRLPKRVIESVSQAKYSREYFRMYYEQYLGVVPNQCFVYTPTWAIDVTHTLRNLAASNPKLAFGYCTAFGFVSELPALLERLSEEEQSALRDHFLTAYGVCLDQMWFDGALKLYQSSCTKMKRWALFSTWFMVKLYWDSEEERTTNGVCVLLSELVRTKDFTFDDEEQLEAMEFAIRHSFPALSSRELPEHCQVEELEQMFFEIESQVLDESEELLLEMYS